MSELEHLRSLADACRLFLKKGSYNRECPFFASLEVELVRTEDFLEEVDKNADLRIRM